MQAFRLSSAELADVFGVSPPRITAMKREGLPSYPNGGHDLRLATTWYVTRLRNQAESTRSDLAMGRARLATAKADREELELAERRGELVSAAEVRDSAFTVSRLSRDNLLSIPDRCAGIIAGLDDEATIHRVMMDEIRRSLTAFTEQCRALAAGAAGEPLPEA